MRIHARSPMLALLSGVASVQTHVIVMIQEMFAQVGPRSFNGHDRYTGDATRCSLPSPTNQFEPTRKTRRCPETLRRTSDVEKGEWGGVNWVSWIYKRERYTKRTQPIRLCSGACYGQHQQRTTLA